MALKVHYGWIDHSNEPTRTQLYFADILANGSNYATLFAPTTGKIDLVRLALDEVTLLNETQVTASVVGHKASGVPPTDEHAQRETAIRFTYIDTVTNEKGRYDVPSPIAGVIPAGTDSVDMAATLVAAFTTVVEANCVSRDGNPIQHVSGRFVGRRN